MRFAVSALLFAAGAAPTAAQSPADLLACVAVARDADRLACFDRAMADASPQARAAAQARAAETARINAAEAATLAAAAKVSAEGAAAAKRDSFGGETVTSRGAGRFSPPEGEIQEVATTVTEVLTNASGQGVFLLENGQLWKQVDTAGRPPVRVGDAVKLTRAPLGGYKLNFLKQKRWALVKRVR